MNLHNIIIFVLALTVVSFADAECERIYRNFVKTISKQKTKTCRVSGVDDDRIDIMGFFFHFDFQGTEYPAVFVYGSDFDEMLYAAPSDEFARTAKCIEGGGFRTIYR